MYQMNLYVIPDQQNSPVVNAEKLKTGREKFLMHFCSKHLDYYEIFDNLDEANKRRKAIESLPEDKVELLFD